jgi:hypothetical protein
LLAKPKQQVAAADAAGKAKAIVGVRNPRSATLIAIDEHVFAARIELRKLRDRLA